MYTASVHSARRGTWRLAAALGAVLLLALFAGVQTASAQGPTEGVVDAACLGLNRQACTAEDVKIASFTVLNVPACLDDGTGNLYADVDLKSTVQTNSTSRYDVGLWISLNGGDAKLDSTNTCYHGILRPLETTSSPFNANGGPYRNLDGDYCGDSLQNDGPIQASLQRLHIKCTDTTGTGFMGSVSSCTSWDNNSNTTCSSVAQAVPGTTSKCFCGPTAITPQIPISQIVVKKVTDPSPDLEGATFSFTATGPGLSPNPKSFTLKNGDAWGSGSVPAGGTYSVVENTPPAGWSKTNAVCTDGVRSYDPAGFTMPAGKTVSCTFTNKKTVDLGIVKTGAVTYNTTDHVFYIDYTLKVHNYGPGLATQVQVVDTLRDDLEFVSSNPGSPTCTINGQVFTCNLGDMAVGAEQTVTLHTKVVGQSTSIYNEACTWNTPVLPPDDNQLTDLNPNCSNTTNTVPVTVSYFRATRSGKDVHFDWSTITEEGNLGFNLYARTDSGWQKVNSELIPSQARATGELTDYTYEAKDVKGDDFLIEDVDIFVRPTSHGPFKLGQPYGDRSKGDRIDWAGIAAEDRGKQAERLNARKTDATAQVRQAQSQLNKARGAGKASATMALPAAASYPTFELRVSSTGVYRLTYEKLAAAGLDLAGVPAGAIALTNRGHAVPIRVAGAEPFGPGGLIEFYGEAMDTLYTTTNVYQLTVDPAAALPMPVDLTAAPAGVAPVPYYMETALTHRQRNYNSSSPIPDPWYDGSMLTYTSPKSWNFTIQLDNVFPAAPDAGRLDVGLWGGIDWPQAPDHHVLVKFNGAQVADDRFDGIVAHPVGAILPAGLAHEGANTLTIVLPGDMGVSYDASNLDKYGLTYPRRFVARSGGLTFTAAGSVFAVTGLATNNVVVYRIEGGAPVRVQRVAVSGTAGAYTATFAGVDRSATYVVSTVETLLVPSVVPAKPVADITSGTAQYVMIAHPNFVAGLAPLANARTARGLSVRVVNVEDVYVQFGNGIFDPQAIRDYIKFAVSHMGTRYVLLVGGDTYDYLNYLGQGAISFIPSIYARTGDVTAFAPVDPLYADVDGNGLPDLPIGRFPVRTTAELDSVVAKTLAYDSKAYGKTAVFAADSPADFVSFSKISDGLAARLPNWTVTRAYLGSVPLATARTALINGINQGAALTTYTGHSSYSAWSFSNLFTTNDAVALTNAGRPTVVLQWGCWNAYYVTPAYNTLAHKFLLSGDRGAAAVLGSTGVTLLSSEEALSRFLMPQIAQPGKTVGDALQAAKAQLATNRPELRDVLLGWTLLGDPTLIVQP